MPVVFREVKGVVLGTGKTPATIFGKATTARKFG